jgi:hypothetical protein
MRLTAEQRRVAREALAEAERLRASPKVKKALIAAGLVESNLRNVNYGDRDSLGFLQQRPSQGWGSPQQVRDVRYATRQFVTRANRLRRRYGSAADLAQAVQRSAFPQRYHQRGADAERVIRALSGVSAGDVAGTRPGGVTTVTTTETIPGVDRSQDRKALLLDYLDRDYEPDALLNLASGLRQAQDTPPETITRTKRIRRPGSPSTPSVPRVDTAGGRRDGRPTPGGSYAGATGLVADAARIAHSLGVQTTSAKRPTRSTASGGVSDHYHGNRRADARDLSNGPRPTPEMDEAAYRIARAFGIRDYRKGTPLVRTIHYRGYRVQLLYRTNVGGNHFNHIHVGARRL